MSLENVQTIAPACLLEIEVAADTLMELCLRMIHGMVNDVIDNKCDVQIGQLEVDCRLIQSHHLASTVEHHSSVYYGPRNSFRRFSSNQSREELFGRLACVLTQDWS